MISKKTLDNTFMGKTYIHSKDCDTNAEVFERKNVRLRQKSNWVRPSLKLIGGLQLAFRLCV